MRLLLTQEADASWSAHILDLDVVTHGRDVWHAIAMAQEAVALVLEWDAGEGRDPLERADRTPGEAWATFQVCMGRWPEAILAEITDLVVVSAPQRSEGPWVIQGRGIPEGALRIAGYDVSYLAYDGPTGTITAYVWKREIA